MRHPTTHTFKIDDLAPHDAMAIAEIVRRGERSAEEVIRAAVNRAKAVDPKIHAIVVDDFDAAIEHAATTNRSPNETSRQFSPFHGVPTFIKDMNDIAGLPTKFGSRALANAPPARRTDPFVQQLLDLGLISLGKSAMPEFGFMPTTEFPEAEATRNPWNLHHTVGGSSGGAGALVAAGVVPIAHAADGGGSIRIPAAACGLVGLKSTRGRLKPSAHTKAQIVKIIVEGVLTRSVRDTAHYFAVAEKRYRNRRLREIGIAEPLTRRLNIAAVSNTPVSGPVDDVTRHEFEKTVTLLERLGHNVIPSTFPISAQLKSDFVRYWSFLAFAMVHAGSLFVNSSFDRRLTTDFSRDLAKEFLPSMATFPMSVYRLRRSAKIADHFFQNVDVLLTPTMGHVTPKIGYFCHDLPMKELFARSQRWACFTPFANATGIPAISLPMGHDSQTNLPVGMMFAAAAGQERLLLELAMEIELACPWRTLRD